MAKMTGSSKFTLTTLLGTGVRLNGSPVVNVRTCPNATRVRTGVKCGIVPNSRGTPLGHVALRPSSLPRLFRLGGNR